MSNKSISFIAFVYLTMFYSIVYSSNLKYKEDEVLVRFAQKSEKSQFNISEKTEILKSLGLGTIKHEYKIVPGLSLVKLSKGKTIKDSLGILNKTKEILYAEPDYKIHLFSKFPNDPCFPYLWGLHNTGQTHPKDHFAGGGFTSGTSGADINAPQAWDIASDSSIIVAVIDTGIDYAHPDLAANMWINPGEIPDNGIDDDGNGYIDDIYGWDFYNWDNEPNDDFFHGTHVAGIIGAKGNDSNGTTGVCWNIKIMSIKIDGEDWESFVSNAIMGMEYARNNGARIINASWGSPYSK